MENDSKDHIHIEIVYAKPDQQGMLSLILKAKSSVKDALSLASDDLTSRFPELLTAFPKLLASSSVTSFPENLAPFSIGIFGKRVTLDKILKEGDRIEIYRPLIRDPKEARRLRAKKNPIKKIKMENKPKRNKPKS